MDLSSAAPFVRPLVALAVVVGAVTCFTADGMSGLGIPVVFLGLGVALAEYRIVPDPWHIKDEDLDAWLGGELKSPGPDHTRR